MACGDVQQVLAAGVDYDLDLAIGRIKFLSTGVLGKIGYGNVTPVITSGTISYWNSGLTLPAGTYRIRYVSGALQYATGCVPPCWSVNTVGAGFHVKYSGGAADVLFPASTSVKGSQADAESDNAGRFIDIVHTGGSIGMYLSDDPYGDNVAGSPNPTFSFDPLEDFCAVRVDFDCPGVLHIPCPSKIDECLPCNDDPVLNLSAEGPDSDRFLFNFNVRQRPPLGFTYENFACKQWCWSDISQLDADLCAIRNAIDCVNRNSFGALGTPSPPFSVPQPAALFFNSAQTCTTFCPDGTAFGATLVAGLVVDRNQTQANRIAHSLACRLSRLRRVCISTKSLTACLDMPYSKQLLAQGGTGFRVTVDNIDTLSSLCSPTMLLLNDSFPYIWSSTPLPAGLSLSPCSGLITGTPTQPGGFSVTIRAEDSLGSFQTKTIILTVVEITDVPNLPDAIEGVPYSHVLTMNPEATYLFQFFSGSPPEWLSLNSTTGELSGTPDAVADFLFEISVESGDGTQCKKEFTLAVVPSLKSYWKLEEAVAPWFDSADGNHLSLGAPTASVPGVIGNGVSVGILEKLGTTNLWVYQNGITMAGWFKFLGPVLSDPGNNGLCGFVMISADTISRFALGANGAGNLFAQASIPFGGTSLVVLSGLVIGAWTFIRMWVDPSDNKIHCKLNEGATQSGPSMTFVTSIPAMNVILQPAALSVTHIDEVGVWGRVLTDAEGAFVYNGGAGKTYPDLPGLV